MERNYDQNHRALDELSMATRILSVVKRVDPWCKEEKMFRGCFEFGQVVSEHLFIHIPPCFTKLRSAFSECTNHEFTRRHNSHASFSL